MDATVETLVPEAETSVADATLDAVLEATLDRLAELVICLTDCPPPLAVAAVKEAAIDSDAVTEDDRLRIVARAMVSVKKGIDLRG